MTPAQQMLAGLLLLAFGVLGLIVLIGSMAEREDAGRLVEGRRAPDNPAHCANCGQTTRIDQHGRCQFCGSDSIVRSA